MRFKLRKAFRATRTLPMAQREIISTIQGSAPELIERCTSSELAGIITALNAHWHKATTWKEREIVGDGYVWDGQQLRDICPPKTDQQIAEHLKTFYA